MELSLTSQEIAAIIEARATRGATTETIRDIASLATARAGDISFLGNPKYKAEVPACAASVIILPIDYDGEPRPGQLYLHVDNPSAALAKLCARIEQLLWPRPAPGIHPSAVIAPTARIAASATVGPLCVVEEGAVIGERTHVEAQVFVGRHAAIGDDCWLMPGVRVASECVVKNRVRLQIGVVLGSDGFGYEFINGRHEKVPQVGRVLIEDDVEIGANTTLDRARFSQTVVGQGTKIDNLVQIAHNVVIGKHCLICSQTGISGSVTIEDYAVLAGQVGVAGHLTIGRGAKITAQTGVNANVSPGATLKGTPANPYMFEQRINVLRQRLPELFQRVDRLEKKFPAEKTSSDA
ncbi:UDP-3-O-(3-hydroxymyristoyl)glucosamine N-acyltransferase [Termitidicoccus mucosus]|uniref:UDP-3-O-acylglucosamine N-acyltransferase n=1 Tax=Termitidicoccus mucosus TaxID=1184151 RepID=A0A178IP21_9BACT|nr:UDP-3-O-(3-hydroxymyristoyl)glucosamine N-acyltransferase [Opitutaceae bacterium TSB47]